MDILYIHKYALPHVCIFCVQNAEHSGGDLPGHQGGPDPDSGGWYLPPHVWMVDRYLRICEWLFYHSRNAIVLVLTCVCMYVGTILNVC